MRPSKPRGRDEQVDLTSKVGLLMKIPLFSRIGPSSLVFLASSSKVVTFHAGQTLFRQGDVAKETYIIMSGEAEVVIEGSADEIAVATVGQYQFIGEIAVLIDVPRTATVVALTNLTTLVISKETFYRIVAEHPVVGIEIMRELAQRLLTTNAQLNQAGSDTSMTPGSRNTTSDRLGLFG